MKEALLRNQIAAGLAAGDSLATTRGGLLIGTKDTRITSALNGDGSLFAGVPAPDITLTPGGVAVVRAISPERAERKKSGPKWILVDDFDHAKGANRDNLSPNQMIAAFWEVRKTNNPAYDYEQPWFRDDTVHSLRPVNGDYRAWHYSRMANRLNEQYVMTVVCDPGVGGKREGMVVKTKKGNYLVGPNNGVFGRVLEDEGIAVGEDGRMQVWKYRQEKFDDIETSTFHGEKAFAPVSAEITDGKHPADLTDWLEPFDGEIILNPLAGDFTGLVPEHVTGEVNEKIKIPGDSQMLLENDGVNLLRFDGHIPPYAVAARVIVADMETGEIGKTVIIPVGERFVDEGPGTLMVYPGSDNPSGVKGRGLTEITASMAVHAHEPTASKQLSPDRPLEIGQKVTFQWLREGDDLKDQSEEAVMSYRWEDRGVPERVLDPEGNVRVTYRKSPQQTIPLFERSST